MEPLQTNRCRELEGAHGSRPDVFGCVVERSKSSSTVSTSLFRLVVTTTTAKLFQSRVGYFSHFQAKPKPASDKSTLA